MIDLNNKEAPELRCSARDSPGKKKMRLDPYLTNPTRGDQLFEKVQKTLVEMSKAKAEVK